MFNVRLKSQKYNAQNYAHVRYFAVYEIKVGEMR